MITTDELWSVTLGCFETQLSLPVVPATVAELPEMCARVNIEGAFAGSVMVSLSPELAVHAARAMFEAPEVGDEEVSATLLELTNMIGGNVKALLAQPSRLGLPQATAGSGRVIQELSGSCEGHPLVVRVYAEV